MKFLSIKRSYKLYISYLDDMLGLQRNAITDYRPKIIQSTGLLIFRAVTEPRNSGKFAKCVVPENIHTPTTEGIDNSGGVGGGVKSPGKSRGEGGSRDKSLSRGSASIHSTKTREIPRNSLEILPNTCWYNIFETYLGYWGC